MAGAIFSAVFYRTFVAKFNRLKGLVIRSTGSWYAVLNEQGETVDCRIKGKFRIQGIKSTNPVSVGDRVEYEQPDPDQAGVITTIGDRKNYIIRKATKLSKQTHVIAANIDLALLITSLVTPATKIGFLDRFLVTAEAYNIPTAIVFNKADLYPDQALDLFTDLRALYEPLGYPCLLVSALDGTNLDVLSDLMKDKINLLAGHSGVGKSTLINAIEPTLDLRTAAVSDYNQKGMHTTTFAEMFPLTNGGFIIDSPGIKSFGLVDIEPTELGHFFPEIAGRMNNCRFNNCVHINEPGCAVKEAVEEGEIGPSRYENYLHLYRGDKDY